MTAREIGEALGGASEGDVIRLYRRAIRKCWRGPQRQYEPEQQWICKAEHDVERRRGDRILMRLAEILRE